MAFVKKTWKDRIVQYANRRLLTKSGGGVEQVTVTRDEGTIYEEGDKFDASNMNDLEQRISDVLDYDKTASGNIVHITDGADNIPVKSLASEIVAVQSGSGEKSPTNPYTISGFANGVVTRCGKNLVAFSTTTVTSQVRILDNIYLKAGVYTFSIDVNNTTNIAGTFNIRIGTTSIDTIGFVGNYQGRVNKKFTLSQDSTINIVLGGASAGYSFTISNAQIEVGDTATTYEPYNGNTYTFNFGQTIFGGYFNNKGGEIANYGFIEFDGSSDENWQTYPSYNGFYININGMNIGTRQFGMCNEFATTYDSSHTNNSCWFGVNSNRLFLIECSDTTGATVEALKTWLASNPLKVFYPLATPRVTTEGEGNLVVTHGFRTLDGSLNYTPNGASTITSRFIVNILGKAYGRTNFISDKFATLIGSDVVGNAVGRPSSSGIEFSLPLTVAQTTADAKQWFTDNPAQLVYELANPITLAITSQDISTLLGENNIFSNCGDVEVDYYTDNADDILNFIHGELSAKADKTEDTTITVASGYTLISSSCGKTDRLVHLNFNVEKSGGFATGWQVIGTTEFKPNTLVYCPLWNVTNGSANGEVRIDTDGTINFYVITAGELRLNANIGYIID